MSDVSSFELRKIREHQMQLAVDGHERPIDFLTEGEVTQLLLGAKKSRYPKRDYLIILMLYRHGLRESELCNLCHNQHLSLDTAQLWINRLKRGLSTWHPIKGDELRAIRAYLRTRTGKTSLNLPWLFVSERGGQLGRHSIIRLVRNAAKYADMRHVSPHMLRHSCGYHLINNGADISVVQMYLGHRTMDMTRYYSRISPKKFEELWNG